jgi:hypothetical protein
MMPDRTKAGMALEAIVGESGQVIKVPHAQGKGTVRFATPLLGSDEWSFSCEQPVAVGDRVFVRGIAGNTLIIRNVPASRPKITLSARSKTSTPRTPCRRRWRSRPPSSASAGPR